MIFGLIAFVKISYKIADSFNINKKFYIFTLLNITLIILAPANGI